jgi:hypothetical protein
VTQPVSDEPPASTAARPTATTGTVRDRIAVLSSSVRTLRDNVASGAVELDPATGQDLCAMLTEQIDRVETRLTKAGDTAPADELARYRDIRQRAHDAVDGAMKEYQSVEKNQANVFDNLVR